MKKIIIPLFCLLILLFIFGCSAQQSQIDILTTTGPLYEFTTALCEGTDLSVACLISENLSCLHNYTLQTKQMRAIESAKIVIISGAGLEESFEDILSTAQSTIDASSGISLLCSTDAHDHHDEHDSHHHENDPHIWLSPENAISMVDHIFSELCVRYPNYAETLANNHTALISDLNALSAYAEQELSSLTTNKLITFHDGFAYLADAFHLEILHAIEEESGREASASELIELCQIIEENNVPCIFTETNGSVSAAQVIAAETGVTIYQLDMAMSGNGYFTAMYNNIDTLKEALE